MAFLVKAFSLGVDLFMVVGPTLGFFDQYQKMQAQQSSEGFSHKVCGVLIVCNMLRLFFCYKKGEVVLFWQSIFMMLVQSMLLELCVRLLKKQRKSSSPTIQTSLRSPLTSTSKSYYGQSSSTSFWGNFWEWTEMFPYLLFLGGLASTVTILSIMFGNSETYVEGLGVVALTIEATVPLPQLFRIRETRSVEGFSFAVLATWVLGDSFKTIYFVLKSAPNQFIACGVFQLICDAIILYYVAKYDPQVRGLLREYLGIDGGYDSLVRGVNVSAASSSADILASPLESSSIPIPDPAVLGKPSLSLNASLSNYSNPSGMSNSLRFSPEGSFNVSKTNVSRQKSDGGL